MNTSVSTPAESHSESPVTLSALEALEKDHRWLKAGAAERAVLERIAKQRDRLTQASKAQQQALALKQEQSLYCVLMRPCQIAWWPLPDCTRLPQQRRWAQP